MINTLMLKAIVSAQNGIARLRDEEEAQTLTEYALIIAVIAIGVLIALYFLRDQIRSLFSKAGASLTSRRRSTGRGERRVGLSPLPYDPPLHHTTHLQRAREGEISC